MVETYVSPIPVVYESFVAQAVGPDAPCAPKPGGFLYDRHAAGFMLLTIDSVRPFSYVRLGGLTEQRSSRIRCTCSAWSTARRAWSMIINPAGPCDVDASHAAAARRGATSSAPAGGSTLKVGSASAPAGASSTGSASAHRRERDIDRQRSECDSAEIWVRRRHRDREDAHVSLQHEIEARLSCGGSRNTGAVGCPRRWI